MAIDAVHLNGAMTGIHDYNTMKHQEASKTVLDQSNFQNQFNQKVDNKQHQVQTKDNAESGSQKFDARDKGNNEYAGDGGKQRKDKNENPDGKVVPHARMSFDMKI